MEQAMHDSRVQNISDLERSSSVLLGGWLAVFGLLRRQSALDYGLLLLGAEMVRRGVTGHCYLYEALGFETAPQGQGAETTSVPYGMGIRVDASVTVNKPRPELYQFWRELDHLPRFMKNVESVTVFEPGRSHWIVRGPAGGKVEWDARIINEIGNERIGWRSVEGSEIDNAGVYSGFVDRFPIGTAFSKGLTLKMGQTHTPKYMAPLLDRIERGEIDPSSVITKRLRLAGAPDAYKRFNKREAGYVKVVLTPQ